MSVSETHSTAILCSSCYQALPWTAFNADSLKECPNCKSVVYALAFPSLFQPINPGKSGETLLVEGEASCFYHPNKKAVIPCTHCGRFLCSLCDVDFNGQHLCPRCIEQGKQHGKMKQLENTRTLYDDIALSLAILPMVTFYFTLITAPIALFFAIRYWNAPTSILGRTKIRFVIAILFALLQIVGWVALFGWLIYRWMN